MTENIIVEFLRQSNLIEGVRDEQSLQESIKAWEYLDSLKVLTVSDILKVHKILMVNQPLADHQKGCFRRSKVYIAGNEVVDWKIVPLAMQNWCFKGIRANPPIDPIALHIEFEKIHPFIDGNGRTGRMLMNWQLIHMLKKAPIVLWASEREEYYKWFKL